MNRICREVQGLLPRYVAPADEGLTRWRRRLVAMHLRRCPQCGAALRAQQAVSAGLEALTVPVGEADTPPEGLLDTLLDQARHPDLRARAAVPARGAVSGARPALSAALLVAGAAAGTAVGYAGWRGARAVRARLAPGVRRTSPRRR